MLVGFAFFIFSQKITEVSYSISKEEIIVSKPEGTPELTLNWKDEPVLQDLKRLKVAIWNSVNEYIDYAAISQTIGFQIKLSGDHTIMSQKISSISRSNLNIESSFNPSNKDVIDFNFKGDDALEINDGIVILIFYVGEETPKIKLLGRIKGIKEEFKLVNWSSIKSPFSEGTSVILYFLGFLFICGVVLILPFFNFTESKKAISIYKSSSLFMGILLCSVPFIVFITVANVWYFGIPWVL